MSKDADLLIIGGGLAGLSTGCYARMNGISTHILEHNLELGGVCTVWRRGDYLIDGCIQWLMGAGPGGTFRPIYDELGVTRSVQLKPLELFHRYEDRQRECVVELTRSLSRYREDLLRLSKEDEGEIDRLLDATEQVRELPPPTGKPTELASVLERLRLLWDARHLAGTFLHFRGTIGEWCERRIHGPALRAYLRHTLLPEMPIIFLPVLLREMADGQIARPGGGSGAFRDAIANRYRDLGGEVTLHTTVEEILVENNRAIGVRLTDGTQLLADTIVSTASAHETHLRLLGGRYLDRGTKERLEEWPLFTPIVLFSAGVALPLSNAPATVIVAQPEPIDVGGTANHTLPLRIYNDDPAFAPKGHCVVQTTLQTSYDWWAERGADYPREKQRLEERLLRRIDQRFPGVASASRAIDLSTPLTFWRHARSWRGSYEGWLPTPTTFRTHVPKVVEGVAGLHLAGQWVEPGGGVPPTLLSGRQVVQILCDERGLDFRTEVPV